MRPTLAALYAVWAAWGISWLIAGLWTGRTVARPPLRREIRYRVLTFAGWALLLSPVWLQRQGAALVLSDDPAGVLWRLPTALEWAMVALLAAGVAFAWWARIYLGRLWSASITQKDGHRIVDSGPYGLVRHPIYTGLLAGAIATTALRGTWAVLIGLPLFVIGYVMKARIEERLMRASLGPGYDAYMARVPMLVPGAPR
jgi:protein-S-isoprenylcysteine O-methyltransferase Ste14